MPSSVLNSRHDTASVLNSRHSAVSVLNSEHIILGKELFATFMREALYVRIIKLFSISPVSTNSITHIYWENRLLGWCPAVFRALYSLHYYTKFDLRSSAEWNTLNWATSAISFRWTIDIEFTFRFDRFSNLLEILSFPFGLEKFCFPNCSCDMFNDNIDWIVDRWTRKCLEIFTTYQFADLCGNLYIFVSDVTYVFFYLMLKIFSEQIVK